MSQRFAGRVCVVAGAARGIGLAIGERLGREGALVATLDVSARRLEPAVAELNGKGVEARGYAVDVSDRAMVRSEFERIEADFGAPVAVLVNNAVWARFVPLADIDEETSRRMLSVGVEGPIWTTQAAAAQMTRNGVAWRRILHGEQSFSLRRPLPVEGAVRAEHRILAVDDKGAGRGAVVHTAHDIFDEATGEPLAALRSKEFLRDDGGCGGFGTPLKLTRPLDDVAEPAAVCDFKTSAQAALLYRQASRDYMPIHADPGVARDAGFNRPISDGLNTFGLACRGVLKRFSPRRPEAIASMAGRFAAPAFPGETIRIEMFETPDGLRFRAQALERSVLVLDRGEVNFR